MRLRWDYLFGGILFFAVFFFGPLLKSVGPEQTTMIICVVLAGIVAIKVVECWTEDKRCRCHEIGTFPCNSKCYFLTDITDNVVMGSDPGYPSTVDVWFSAVTVPLTIWIGNTTLSPDQVRHIWSQFEQGKVLYPELKAFMVFSSKELF